MFLSLSAFKCIPNIWLPLLLYFKQSSHSNFSTAHGIHETLYCLQQVPKIFLLFFPELGTRQHCRDNVTMFSGYTVVKLNIALLLCHLSTETIIFFEFFLVTEALHVLRCRVPSSVRIFSNVFRGHFFQFKNVKTLF